MRKRIFLQRFLAVLLVLAVAFSLMACGGSEKEDAPTPQSSSTTDAVTETATAQQPAEPQSTQPAEEPQEELPEESPKTTEFTDVDMGVSKPFADGVSLIHFSAGSADYYGCMDTDGKVICCVPNMGYDFSKLPKSSLAYRDGDYVVYYNIDTPVCFTLDKEFNVVNKITDGDNGLKLLGTCDGYVFCLEDTSGFDAVKRVVKVFGPTGELVDTLFENVADIIGREPDGISYSGTDACKKCAYFYCTDRKFTYIPQLKMLVEGEGAWMFDAFGNYFVYYQKIVGALRTREYGVKLVAKDGTERILWEKEDSSRPGFWDSYFSEILPSHDDGVYYDPVLGDFREFELRGYENHYHNLRDMDADGNCLWMAQGADGQYYSIVSDLEGNPLCEPILGSPSYLYSGAAYTDKCVCDYAGNVIFEMPGGYTHIERMGDGLMYFENYENNQRKLLRYDGSEVGDLDFSHVVVINDSFASTNG